MQAFLAKHRVTQVCQPPLQPRFGSLRLWVFPKAKIAVENKEICECDSHTVHKLSQQRLTADWLAPRESDFTDAQYGLLRLAAKLYQGHVTGSRDIQNGLILSGQAIYFSAFEVGYKIINSLTKFEQKFLTSIQGHLMRPQLSLRDFLCTSRNELVKWLAKL